jgi:aquaporin related protein
MHVFPYHIVPTLLMKMLTAIAHHLTDGTNETDFAACLQNAKGNPTTMPRRTASSAGVNPILPAFNHGGDAHHSSDSSDESLDHPNNRPRAQHTHSSRRSSQSNYDMASDHSYRHGPSAESSRSSS